jgi:hypothetical protein
MEPASYDIHGDKTVMTIKLEERESVFVIFNKKTTALSRHLPAPQYGELMNIGGPWNVRFPDGSGAPAAIVFDSLISWTNSSDEGVKYFSGTATYNTSFEFKKDPGRSKLLLDLGKVGDIAEIKLNGKKLGIVWKAPYQIDITNSLQKGKNQLEIKVTNEWTNRLVGDRDAPVGKKVLPVYTNPFGGQYVPGNSGLMGPVKLIATVNELTK